jgi:hypothetical protein
MTRCRPFGLFVVAAAAVWTAAYGTAQPPPKFKVGPPPPQPRPFPRPVGSDSEPYTAFPELTFPLKWWKMPNDPPGRAIMIPDDDAVFARLKALLARPVPPDAPPLRKVRLAQVYEGAVYVYMFGERMRIGFYTSTDYGRYVAIVADVFRAAAEVEDDPAGKVAFYEDRVRLLKVAEWYTVVRTNVGTDPPYALNETRFYRLQAEVELLKLKADLAAARPGPK